MCICAVTRCPRRSSPPSDRALTLRGAALVDIYNNRRKTFIKTVVTLPDQASPAMSPLQEAPAEFWHSAAPHASQSSSLSANSFTSAKPPYIPRAVYLRKKAPKTGKTSNSPRPHVVNLTMLTFSSPQHREIPPYVGGGVGGCWWWWAGGALQCRKYSGTCAPLSRAKCPLEIARLIIATSFRNSRREGPHYEFSAARHRFLSVGLTRRPPARGVKRARNDYATAQPHACTGAPRPSERPVRFARCE